MQVWIGCSGFQYSGWKPRFYPEKLAQSKWLSYYAEHFNTVEINSSFYRFPQAKTMEKWKSQVPDGFKYSLKAPKFITHYHQFNDTERMLNDFYQLADILEDKLGCILFQFPAKTAYSPELLNRMLEQLNPRYKNVIEFRHPSWWQPQVYQALLAANISFCHLSGPVDFPDYQHTEPLYYLRFHGLNDWYKGSHQEELPQWYQKIMASKAEEAWIYFNNTMSMDAIYDANMMQNIQQASVLAPSKTIHANTTD